MYDRSRRTKGSYFVMRDADCLRQGFSIASSEVKGSGSQGSDGRPGNVFRFYFFRVMITRSRRDGEALG